jgi:hypothetical protein
VLALRSRSEFQGPRRLAAEVTRATRAARRDGAVRLDVSAADLGHADRFAAVLAAVDAALAAGAVPTTHRLPAMARAA